MLLFERKLLKRYVGVQNNSEAGKSSPCLKHNSVKSN